MAKASDAKNALAQTKVITIQELIEKQVKELGRAVPEHFNPERLARLALTTLRKSPKLDKVAQKNPMSFLGALFQCAQLGLELDVGGQAYIIPYGDECVFQLGYAGFRTLFYRHEASSHLEWGEVCEKDSFDYEKGTSSFLKHKIASGDRGKPTHYWVMAHLQNGGAPFEVMTVEDCDKHGKRYSKAYEKSDSPWQDEHGRKIMRLKTVLIQLVKIIPTSTESQKAVEMDNTIKSRIRADMSEVKDETDWTEAEVIDTKPLPLEAQNAPVSDSKDVSPAQKDVKPTAEQTEGSDGMFERGKCEKCGDEALINSKLCGECTVDKKRRADAENGK